MCPAAWLAFVAESSGRAQNDSLSETDNSQRCINCDTQELVNATGHRPWRRLAVVSVEGGSLEMLEEWPLCPDCETSQGAALVQYVRLKLA